MKIVQDMAVDIDHVAPVEPLRATKCASQILSSMVLRVRRPASSRVTCRRSLRRSRFFAPD